MRFHKYVDYVIDDNYHYHLYVQTVPTMKTVKIVDSFHSKIATHEESCNHIGELKGRKTSVTHLL